MRLSTERILHAGLAASIVILGTTSWVAWRAQSEILSAARLVEGSHQFTHEAQSVLIHVAEAESAARGHAISGAQSFLDEHAQSAAEARIALAQMDGLASLHPEQVVLVRQLHGHVSERLAQIDELVRIRREQGEAAAEHYALTDAQRENDTALRELGEKVLHEEAGHLMVLEHSQETAAAATVRAALLALVGGVLLGGLALGLVHRDLRRRREAHGVSEEIARLVGAAEDAIIGLTPDGVVRSWNAGAEHLYGWTASEIVGQSIEVLVPPQLLDEMRDQLTRLGRGERVPGFETVRKRRDGSLVAAWVVVSPVRDGDGNFVGISSISRDLAAVRGRRMDGDDTVMKLRQAAARARSLSDLLPTCAWCKSIRDEKGEWRTFESYLGEHMDASFTHGICPTCSTRLSGKPAAANQAH